MKSSTENDRKLLVLISSGFISPSWHRFLDSPDPPHAVGRCRGGLANESLVSRVTTWFHRNAGCPGSRDKPSSLHYRRQDGGGAPELVTNLNDEARPTGTVRLVRLPRAWGSPG